MWLYTVDIILFLILDAVIMQQAMKMRSSYYHDIQLINVPSISHRSRTCFILLCLIANITRTLSIFILDVTWFPIAGYSSISYKNTDLEMWSFCLLRTFPCLLHLSSYSVVILFWAHVYYTAILINTPYMVFFFVVTNIIVYMLYIVTAILFLVLNHLLTFIPYALFLIGILYILVSISLLYFGWKVTSHLSRRTSSGTVLRYNVIQRVLFLTVFCPLLLICRGSLSIMQAVYHITGLPVNLQIIDNSPLGDTCLFLATELLPSIIVLVSFWQKRSPPTLTISARGLGFTSGVFNTGIHNNEPSQFALAATMPLIQPTSNWNAQTEKI
ncbi:uncharacterized protein CMU_013340 [Cryptosporidium muris RN66]|uniref:THH1/TOM1/TOM3 domain-containing protein n=1 Tax=Cryptosporidium muris (strain RN66) TaxID=441375 RepID=B6AEP2_CRYMR|nr:uncharacterized protein CMU_013340 [Cryptosporidium muris RN66]EEA06659.1 hypothetical protein, conserved [Cryptosporidium muris RN66]|eukprot:XP_002141008.1 hypothetical protein [Cryptosporidium muris RN66]